MSAKTINVLKLEDSVYSLEQIEALLFFIHDSIAEGPNALNGEKISYALQNLEAQLKKTINDINNITGLL